jgi:acetyltransferase-like isoleucine patch superfamily enzyme
MGDSTPAWVHPTALVEEGVTLGANTRVWGGVHIRKEARVGHDTIVGEKTYLAYGVRVGNYVKINAVVYVCAEVEIEDFCMISAHTVFTNDRFPRSGNRQLTGLETSDPTEETLRTRVRRGVSIGANATIGPGLTLGEFSMVGMGSVVTRDVPPHALVLGNPARIAGWVCACGHPLVRSRRDAVIPPELRCERCERAYVREGEGVRPSGPIASAP